MFRENKKKWKLMAELSLLNFYVKYKWKPEMTIRRLAHITYETTKNVKRKKKNHFFLILFCSIFGKLCDYDLRQ